MERDVSGAQQFVFPGSSYLLRATYDPASQVLTVEFRSGGVCQHSGVPEEVADMLEMGGGSYYRSALYGRYGARNL